ncbi:hypothetical protein ATHEMM101B_17545 [Atlantibacter hermannii]|nr:hypothetical protein [Enterobacteriaceae bacterium]
MRGFALIAQSFLSSLTAFNSLHKPQRLPRESKCVQFSFAFVGRKECASLSAQQLPLSTKQTGLK